MRLPRASKVLLVSGGCALALSGQAASDLLHLPGLITSLAYVSGLIIGAGVAAETRPKDQIG